MVGAFVQWKRKNPRAVSGAGAAREKGSLLEPRPAPGANESDDQPEYEAEDAGRLGGQTYGDDQ
jgi:hypothetical protein